MAAQYIQDITILSGVLKCKNGLLSGQQWKPSGFRLLGRNGRIFNQINRVVAFRCSGYTECQVGGKERLLDADFRV